MNPKWAEENLQTIRTLMERSALYRRALAPIMIYVGVVGIAGGMVGWRLQVKSVLGFVAFWSGVALVALTGAFLLVRRQALKDSEPFWSPPTRRVAQALAPGFFIGVIAGCLSAWQPGLGLVREWDLPAFWILLYGCALHSAGFFMVRGIKLFSWLFIICGVGLICIRLSVGGYLMLPLDHLIMGEVFGGLHFIYGIYLYFTEKKNPVT